MLRILWRFSMACASIKITDPINVSTYYKLMDFLLWTNTLKSRHQVVGQTRLHKYKCMTITATTRGLKRVHENWHQTNGVIW